MRSTSELIGITFTRKAAETLNSRRVFTGQRVLPMTTILNILTLPLRVDNGELSTRGKIKAMHTLIKGDLICCYAMLQAHVVANDNAQSSMFNSSALHPSNRYVFLNLQ
jgi:hypothetical protein